MVSLTCTALLEIQKMAFEKERRELQEAAEFEERVAAKLAKGIPQSAWLAEAEKCDMPPSWSRMKLARL